MRLRWLGVNRKKSTGARTTEVLIAATWWRTRKLRHPFCKVSVPVNNFNQIYTSKYDCTQKVQARPYAQCLEGVWHLVLFGGLKTVTPTPSASRQRVRWSASKGWRRQSTSTLSCLKTMKVDHSLIYRLTNSSTGWVDFPHLSVRLCDVFFASPSPCFEVGFLPNDTG